MDTEIEQPRLERLLNSKEVCELLRVRKGKSLRNLGIPFVAIGNRHFYDPADVRRWIDENKQDPDADRRDWADFKERNKRFAKQEIERERQEEKRRLEALTRDPEGMARHLKQQAWEEGYERRKQERRALGLPERGCLPAGTLAAARKAKAELDATRKGKRE